MTKLEKKQDIEDDGNSQKGKGDVGENVDFGAYGFEVFEKFLLFKGIAVGGFADRLQVVFDALEGSILLDHLVAQGALLDAEVC